MSFPPEPLRRHPLPWSLPGRKNWVRLEPAGHPHDSVLTCALVVGSSRAEMTRADLLALHAQVEQVLNAPHRLLVVGGDHPDLTAARGPLFDWLDGYRYEHPNLEIVHNPAESMAQICVEQWRISRRCPAWPVERVEYSLGGSAVLILPMADRDAALAHAGQAYGRHNIPCIPPRAIWDHIHAARRAGERDG